MLSRPQCATARSNSDSVRCLVTPLSARWEYVVKACGGSGRCSLITRAAASSNDSPLPSAAITSPFRKSGYLQFETRPAGG